MQATSRALDLLLRAVGDPLAALSGIGPDHPEFDRALTIRAAAAVLAKTPETLPEIAKTLRAADRRTLALRSREHLAAASAWLADKPVLAAETYASILSRWPDDLLALRLAQSCYFFLGWHDRLSALVDEVMTGWNSHEPAFQFVLAMASFAHAENGDAAYAEALGRKALARNRSCPLGVHAVAHAITQSGRLGAGAKWMRDQREQWATESRMRSHNAWHLAMFDVEDGNAESALDILDTWLLPASAHSALDACDAAALLWRLSAGGIHDERGWRTVSDAFERTMTPGFWPFVDMHAALAHLLAGERERAQRLTRSVEHVTLGSSHAALRARHVTSPALHALTNWAEGQHSEAAATFARLRPFLGNAGGSRIQLESFERIGREAERRARARGPAQGRSVPTEQTAAFA